MVRMLLLTGQRREKVSTMRWSDIEDGVWKIPPQLARRVTAASWCCLRWPGGTEGAAGFASNPFVFAGRKRHYNGLSKAKARLDAELKLKRQWGCMTCAARRDR